MCRFHRVTPDPNYVSTANPLRTFMKCHNVCRFGALGAYHVWFDKTIAAFQVLGSESLDYGSESYEVVWLSFTIATFAPLCGFEADALALLGAIGFSEWEGVGFEQCWPAVSAGFPFLAQFNVEWLCMIRLLLFLASPIDQAPVSNEAMAAFMPSPQVLVEMDRIPVFQ